MIVKGSDGQSIRVTYYGTGPDDIEILSAMYVNSRLDVSDLEMDYLLEKYYNQFAEDLFSSMTDSGSMYDE